MTAVTNQSINTLLARGVRNIWYPICPSSFIAESRSRCAAWASSSCCGAKRAASRPLEDHCPHRGAPLSIGIAMGDRTAYGYHGVQVRCDGVVIRCRAAPGSRLEGKKCVRVFPTRSATA